MTTGPDLIWRYVGGATTTGSTRRKYIHQIVSKSSILERSGSIARSSGHVAVFSGRVDSPRRV